MRINLFRSLDPLFAPDDVASGGGAAAPAVEATPAAAPSAPTETPPPAAPAVAGTTPGAVPTGAPTTPAPAAAAPSWLDNLRTAGIPVGANEQETIAGLTRLHQERQQLEQLRGIVPHVQQYLTHAQQFNKWLADQQKAQAVAKPGQKNFYDEYWNPPEYDPTWETQVTKDAQGNLIAVPGASPAVVAKVQQWQEFQAKTAREMLKNPHKFIEPTARAIARQEAQAIIQQQMQQMQDQQRAQEFTQRNSAWLYDVDAATGAPKTKQTFDPNTGGFRSEPVLSQWGQKFSEYAQGVFRQQESRGYHDEAEAMQIAMTSIQRDFAMHQYEQARNATPAGAPATPAAPQKTAQELANEAFLAKNNPGGKRAPAAGNAVPGEAAINSKTLREEMLKALTAAGYKDGIN